MSMSVADMRKDYTQQSLGIQDVSTNPMLQFGKWFNEATQAQLSEANAMHLATISPEGWPEGRIVLLKGVEDDAFMFYTNYHSSKGKALAHNPRAALTFFWVELERQVRIEGEVQKVSPDKSTAYFHSRPRGSQIGAWASPQSEVIPNRTFLEDHQEALNRQYEDKEIPRPEHWGGYAVYPHTIEFWQGRSSRLHDRIRYTKTPERSWNIERLAP